MPAPSEISAGWQAADLELVDCDHCGPGPRAREVTTRPDGMRVVECSTCRLAWLNPRPRGELVTRLYDRSYFCGERQVAGIGYADYGETAGEARTQQAHAEARLALIARQFPLIGAQLLEIGCATGDFCASAHDRGATTLGVDVSPDAVDMARRRYPALDFRASTAEELATEGPDFDVVCAFEVIEHVLSPVGFLRAVQRLTRPGGLIVLSTPNYAMAGELGAERWLGFRTSFEHLYFLSPQSLRTAANAAGLELVDWYTSGSGLWTDPAVLTARRPLRRLLETLHLLGAARAVKRLLRRPSAADYRRRAPGHTLLAVLRRTDRTATSSRD